MKLLKQKELAAHYGVTTVTVRQWEKQGMPMRRSPGGPPRYCIEDIEAWSAAQFEKMKADAFAPKRANLERDCGND